MPLEYDHKDRLKAVQPILDDAMIWYANFALYVSFEAEPVPPKIQSFQYWMREVSEDPDYVDFNLAELEEQYQKMMELAQAFTSGFVTDRETQFRRITQEHKQLCAVLRRAELHALNCDLGLDEVSGLRNKNRLVKDYEREMQRVSRDGQRFSVLLLKQDFFETVRQEQGELFVRSAIQKVSAILREALRSYDDAYYMNNGEFLVIVRQADVPGSLSVSGRVQEVIKDNDVIVNEAGEEIVLSLSHMVSEPLPGDDLETLLSNMRTQLAENKDEAGSVHEYRDISPLEMYVQNQGD